MMVRTPLVLMFTNLTIQGILAGARVDLNPILPMLILEDIDNHVALINCSDSTIIVHLQDLSSFDAATSAWSNETGFAVMTNHNGCQMEGEHGVRRFVGRSAHRHHANCRAECIRLIATVRPSLSPYQVVQLVSEIFRHL